MLQILRTFAKWLTGSRLRTALALIFFAVIVPGFALYLLFASEATPTPNLSESNSLDQTAQQASDSASKQLMQEQMERALREEELEEQKSKIMKNQKLSREQKAKALSKLMQADQEKTQEDKVATEGKATEAAGTHHETLNAIQPMAASPGALLAALPLLTGFVSIVGTTSTVVLAWRADKRSTAESQLKVQQLEQQIAELSKKLQPET